MHKVTLPSFDCPQMYALSPTIKKASRTSSVVRRNLLARASPTPFLFLLVPSLQLNFKSISPPVTTAFAFAAAPTPPFSSASSSAPVGSRSASFLHRRLFGSTARSYASTSNSLSMSILESPSAERNKDPILAVLQSEVLPELLPSSSSLRVLEVAAGCGVHTVHFARGISSAGHTVQWYPTDPSQSSRESIDARVAALDNASDAAVKGRIMAARSITLDAEGVIEGRGDGIQNLPNPIADLSDDSGIDLVININMIHISPWEATIGLMRTASKLLRNGGILYCYGPYKVNGKAVESNLNFDRSLKSRDPAWGVRNLEDVIAEAERHGLKMVKTIGMPANNLSVIYKKE